MAFRSLSRRTSSLLSRSSFTPSTQHRTIFNFNLYPTSHYLESLNALSGQGHSQALSPLLLPQFNSRLFSSTASVKPEEKISVSFLDKDGEVKHVNVPIGMSMLEAAIENDVEIEEYYNKLEDPTDEENDMLDLAFGLTETSRLGCQVIAKPELNGMRLAIPTATGKISTD